MAGLVDGSGSPRSNLSGFTNNIPSIGKRRDGFTYVLQFSIVVSGHDDGVIFEKIKIYAVCDGSKHDS